MEKYPGSSREFYYYPNRPEKITPEFVEQEYQKILDQVDGAEVSEYSAQWLNLYSDWNELKAYIDGEEWRARIRLAQNTADPEAIKTEEYIREEIIPVTAEPNHVLMESFLRSQHLPALTSRFGGQLIPQYEAKLITEHPINKDLRTQEGGLIVAWEELTGQGRVDVHGQELSLQEAHDLIISSDDPAVRRRAYMARKDWFIGKRQQLADIYDKQVKIRQQMAQNLSLDSFVPLAYKIMQRQDYGPEEVRQFREKVKEHIVPIRQTILRDRAERQGITALSPWDGPYDPRAGFDQQMHIPTGILSIEKQWSGTQELFAKMSPQLAFYFDYMRDNNLIDLENRPNKADGAIAYWLNDEKKIFLICNSTGNTIDVFTLMHEIGHAFQGWESMDIESVDLKLGTLELAEVYSTGMEFLSLPYMESYFPAEQSAKFRQRRYEDSIHGLCYISAVDEFQHWVYENPEATPSGRDEAWNKISSTYLPGIDYSGLEPYESIRWYEQKHIFGAPFYYIDYGLAEIVALQLARLDEQDHEATLAKYLELCKIGGTKSFLEVLDYAGLDSPFNEDALVVAAGHIAKQLGLK